MSGTIEIRKMGIGDVALGLSLCRCAGWNQLEEDWLRLLHVNRDSIFVAEYDGRICGTAAVTCYGTALAWVGMILVHPDLRRRGVAGTLIEHTLAYTRDAGIECVKLDATEQGRLVYLNHHFEDEAPIWRYDGSQAAGADAQLLPQIEEEDWNSIAALDLDVFGADRLRLLKLLAKDGVTAVVKTSGRITGYGFARPGFHASFLGPMIAGDPSAARLLAEALLSRVSGNGAPACWDILVDNASAQTLAESLGFKAARKLTRMRFGALRHPGKAAMVYGAAGFEMG